ncbi:DUF350 domain-containing protein [Fluviicola sp.]|uniref:DUF350 domain-containing protein n=1 Tax=Fluviicola sp. TaxID=1917219 RepID=UPI002610D74F|nr:DUF350 domain-containing protein [Fluviicola sp.]
MKAIVDWNTVLASLIYAGLGIFVLLLSFIIIEKLTPQNLWKEIWQNKNMALALLGSAYMIAVAIIIASAIH